MKILYLTKGDHVDYQNDCLLIGLKELFGSDVVDYNKQQHNYDTYNADLAKSLYGMGMTVSRVLPDLLVDRDDITSKIKNKYFDLIIYGSIWRCSDHITQILEYYPKHKVIAIDGEDETNINHAYKLGIPYFKREMVHDSERLFPITFAMPTSKVNFNKIKTKDFSFITPLDKSTYIYKNEKDYYNDYSGSRLGVTMKKAGWDCMRHYEILGNGCIPYFIDINNCPSNTMFNFPKQLCKDVINDLKTNNVVDLYDKYAVKFETHFKSNNTTIELAKYVLTTVK